MATKSPVQVVLLGHRARVGKDTLAEYLVKEQGFIRIGFADKLKEMVADLYGFSHEQMYGSEKDVPDERYPNNIDPKEIREYYGNGDSGYHLVFNPEYKSFLTPRRILQTFGQDQRRIFQNVWAQYVFNQIDAISSCGDPSVSKFVITDLRFPNEYEVAKHWERGPNQLEMFPRKVLAIQIIRPDLPPISGADDISETALANFEHWDGTIVNDTGIDDLYGKYNTLRMILDNVEFQNILNGAFGELNKEREKHENQNS